MMNRLTRPTGFIILVMAAALTIAMTACDGEGDEATETPTPVGGATPTATVEAEPTPEPTPGTTPEPPPTTVTEPTPTTVPEPTPVPATGGMDGFRAFAQQVEQAIANKDVQFFIDRARITEETCPGEPMDMVPLECVGQPAGTVIEGVKVGPWRSEWTLVLTEEYPGWLDRYFTRARGDLNDTYGNGSIALYALAQRPEGQEFSAVTTYIADANPWEYVYAEPTRVSRIFHFEFEDGRWQLVSEMFDSGISFPDAGTTAPPEWLAGDCTICYDHWERWEGAP